MQMFDPVLNDIGMKLFTTPRGDEYYAWQKASLEDELAMEQYNDTAPEDFPIEDEYEDPDSDGYGWERHALRSAWI
jgi:hypothetical protein